MEEEEKEICDYCFCDIDKDKVVLDKYGDTVCQDRIDAHYEKCDNCGKYVRASETVSLGHRGTGYIYCQDCADECCGYCDDCDDCYESDDLVWIEEMQKMVCPHCINDYQRCSDCGDLTTEDRPLYGGGYLCKRCSEYHCYCEDCGMYLANEDERFYDGYVYCPDCCPEDDRIITDYHAHHNKTIPYYNDNDVTTDECEFQGGYGFELEVDGMSNEYHEDATETATKIKEILGEHCYFEYDGSLWNGGFEIISCPHTRQAMENLYPQLKDAFKVIKEDGFRSHDSERCGLHVHASRTLFGDTETERTENIAKLILFYEMFWDDLVKVSRRKCFNYCYRMSSDDSGDDGDEIETIEDARAIAKKEITKDRYHSINLENDATVEFRLMRGTLNYDTFRATLDFTMTLIENCKNIPMDKISHKELWLDGIKDYTIEYLKKRKAFGYADGIEDEVEDEEEDCSTEC